MRFEQRHLLQYLVSHRWRSCVFVKPVFIQAICCSSALVGIMTCISCKVCINSASSSLPRVDSHSPGLTSRCLPAASVCNMWKCQWHNTPVTLCNMHTYPPSQHVHGLIITCYVAAAHYLALDFDEQIYEPEKMQRSVALAGLRYLAALIVHAAQMDSCASVAPETLTTPEAANTSVTGIRHGWFAMC